MNYKNNKIYLAILMIVILVIFDGNTIGVRASNLEKDARDSGKIDKSWEVFKDVRDPMSVVLFYAEDLEDYSFSLYVKRKGFSFGYFFRAGGSVPEVVDNIAEVVIDGYDESAYISINKQQVSKVTIDKGNDTETINIDSKKPFAFVLPNKNASVKFYNTNGKVIESFPFQM